MDKWWSISFVPLWDHLLAAWLTAWLIARLTYSTSLTVLHKMFSHFAFQLRSLSKCNRGAAVYSKQIDDNFLVLHENHPC
jgi:hypothetical protein